MPVNFKVTVLLESESISSELKMAQAIKELILSKFDWITVKGIDAIIVSEKEKL